MTQPTPKTAGALQPDQTCRDCGAVATVEVWRRGQNVACEIEESGRRVVYVRGTPDWAAEYALQGVDRVTRYTCPACNEVLAILAADEG